MLKIKAQTTQILGIVIILNAVCCAIHCVLDTIKNLRDTVSISRYL